MIELKIALIVMLMGSSNLQPLLRSQVPRDAAGPLPIRLSAAGRHAPRALEKWHAHVGMLGSACDIVESAQQPQAHRCVSNRVAPDPLKRRFEQAVEGYPRHEQPQYVRPGVIVRWWR